MGNRGRSSRPITKPSRVWQFVALGSVAVVTLVFVAFALQPAHPPAVEAHPSQSRASETPIPEARPSQSPSETPLLEPTRVAVVGDSNTEVDSPAFNAGQISPNSWVTQLLNGGFEFAGGWAVGGSTSTAQAEGLAPVADVDVLLIMTGTNDLAFGLPFEETAAAIDAMVAKAPAGRVVLLAIPPRDIETGPTSAEFNAALQTLAAQRGWDYFDGLESVRAPEGGFAEGTTIDGLHLSPEAEAAAGQAVLAYLNG